MHKEIVIGLVLGPKLGTWVSLAKNFKIEFGWRVFAKGYISNFIFQLKWKNWVPSFFNTTHLTWCRIALKKQNNKACCPSILCIEEISLNSNEGRKWRHNDIWMSFFWKSYQWVKEFSVNQLLFPANFHRD